MEGLVDMQKKTENGRCMIKLWGISKASMEGWEGPMGVKGRMLGGQGYLSLQSVSKSRIALAFRTFFIQTCIYTSHRGPRQAMLEVK